MDSSKWPVVKNQIILNDWTLYVYLRWGSIVLFLNQYFVSFSQTRAFHIFLWIRISKIIVCWRITRLLFDQGYNFNCSLNNVRILTGFYNLWYCSRNLVSPNAPLLPIRSRYDDVIYTRENVLCEKYFFLLPLLC